MVTKESRGSARRQAVILLYQHDVTDLAMTDLEENLQHDRPHPLDDYTRAIIDGVTSNREEIDQMIDDGATGWSVDRIAPLERNILRVAIQELRYRDDIPVAVAIDEAVAMAKRYCQADAAAFVNGVLGTIVRSEGGAG